MFLAVVTNSASELYQAMTTWSFNKKITRVKCPLISHFAFFANENSFWNTDKIFGSTSTLSLAITALRANIKNANSVKNVFFIIKGLMVYGFLEILKGISKGSDVSRI